MTAVADPVADPVADKVVRYAIALDPTHEAPRACRGEAWRFTAKADPRQVHWVVRTRAGEWFYDGPPWKAHHREYYFDAVRALLLEGSDFLAEPPPVPENGPLESDRCPQCGGAWAYEQGYVGGRGYCWRNVCGCGYRSEWQ